MPDPKERKTRKTAQDRASQKYFECPNSQNPQHMFPAIKELTNNVRSILNTKNFIRILTQTDLNQFIMIQYYIYCDEDVWVTGEALVFNANPDKKIMVRTMCSKSKTYCVCYDESTEHFLTICPHCKTAVDMIKNTPFKCKHCGITLPWQKIERMPYAKIPCEWCPVECGWEKTEKLSDMIMGRLVAKKSELQKNIEDEISKFKQEIGLDG
jgi:hypothetical protein